MTIMTPPISAAYSEATLEEALEVIQKRIPKVQVLLHDRSDRSNNGWPTVRLVGKFEDVVAAYLEVWDSGSPQDNDEALIEIIGASQWVYN